MAKLLASICPYMDSANTNCDDTHCDNTNCAEEECQDTDEFQLPIAFLEQKNILEEHTITDLELLPTKNTESLYNHVFKPKTLFGEKNIPLWSKYYTADTDFLKETQTLLKNKNKTQEINTETQYKMSEIWNEIQAETNFEERYSYIEWRRLALLNSSSKFLQWLSIYNMASPIFSLMLPIFFLILPLLIIKIRGLPITISSYIELLKVVFKKHQLGQIFDLSKASFEKIIYVLASVVFYVIQVYQNIMACRKFYYNMSKIHDQLFTVRDYLDKTLQNMEVLEKQCAGLKTYEPFIAYMTRYRATYLDMLKDLKRIRPNKLSVKKIFQIGHTMQCFYRLYKNEEFKTALYYSFGLNGYLDNLNGVRENMEFKYINPCKFIKGNNKASSVTKFKNAYFPTLVNNNPVKNSYKLDKHILITGPNAAGKTTLLKTTIFNIILSQQLGFGFYKNAKLQPYDMIHCYINIPDTSARDSLFQAEAKRCKDILTKISTIGAGTSGAGTSGAGTSGAGKQNIRHFCVFDELYSGTNPYEAISSAYSFLKYLHNTNNVNFIITTHFLDLCKRLEEEKKMQNYHMKIEACGDDFKYTYKMEKGISEIKGGVKVLKDLEYPQEIINMTSQILKELTM